MLTRRRLAVLAALVGVCSVSAAGMALAAGHGGSSPVAGPRTAVRPVAAAVSSTRSNRRAAIRDAGTLLADVVPPAGAVLQSSGTAIGARGDRLLTLATDSAVAYRSWAVAEKPRSVL